MELVAVDDIHERLPLRRYVLPAIWSTRLLPVLQSSALLEIREEPFHLDSLLCSSLLEVRPR